MIMSVAAACLLAGCGNPVAPLQAGQAVEPGVVQASVAETPDQCREVTFTITGPETVVGQWPDSTCHEGLKVIAGAPMEWQEEGGRRLRMIVRYVNLTGVAVGLPLDVMLPVGSKFPLDPPTAAHSTMVPLEFDSLGINGRTWWILSGPAGVLGVGDTSRVDTLLFQIKEPVLSARFRFNHYPVEAATTGAVPMQAPDSKPPWFGDDSSWTQGGVRKWAVGLRFLPGATQAQRDAAVTSARGQVVGGLASALGGEGLYYIRLPWAFEVDSLIAAVTLLDQQPGVKFAILLSKPQTLARPSARFNRFPVEATTDTTRPVPPSPTAFPQDSLLLVASPSGVRYRRTVFHVVFSDTTSGVTIRSFMTQFSATIIGRMGPTQGPTFPWFDYYFTIPDPGATWEVVDSLNVAMTAYQGVEVAGALARDNFVRFRGSVARGGNVTSSVPMQAPDTQPSWFQDDSSFANGVRKRVVAVQFNEGATQAERDSAIARVRGAVIGGLRWASGGEGLYYVHLSWAQDVGSLIGATVTLEQQQAVRLSVILSRAVPRAGRPTDTLPAWTQDDSSYAGGWLKRVLNIEFEPFVTQANRESIITQIGGIVIGGAPSMGPEGEYYVLLPGNPSLAEADSIALVLKADPRVVSASAAFRGGIRAARLQGDGQGRGRSEWAPDPPALVPAQAPDSKPTWFQDDSSYANGVLKRVVSVQFVEGASLPEKQAAVASVRASVTGGMRWSSGGEGVYYLLLSWAVEVDSLIAATRTLEGRPAVKWAVILSEAATLGRRSSQSRFDRRPVVAITDTTRPVAPYPTVFPRDSLLLVMSPRGVRYRRTVFHVAFADTTSGVTIRAFMAQFSANIIGRMATPTSPPFPWFEYYFTISDPGPSWQAVDSLVTAMNAFQGVEAAGSIAFDNVVRFR